ncbi:MAG: fluoride efflux transporter CrcB [Deltaproteobacteria bacterium]|nr:MAG: fluoride efflux transporter CrcB [Deltaproteobacteria bacterium]
MREALLTALLVGSGGFLGALLRYGVGGVIHRRLPFVRFPYGTLAVNMLGCLAIGLLTGLLDASHLLGPSFRKFVLIGLLGAFTTYSTFLYETFAMLQDAEYLLAAANVGIQLVLGLFLVWLGHTLVMAR